MDQSKLSVSQQSTSPSYPDSLLFIGNTWREAQDGARLPVVNPATGHHIGTVAKASATDVDESLFHAQQGFQVWSRTPASARSEVLDRAAQLLRARAPEIARLMTLEQGKPLAESLTEVLSAAQTIAYFSQEGPRIAGRVVQARFGDMQQLVVKEPVGVVAAFTPWNFPVNQAARKVAAALTAGCSIVLKAAEETPASPSELVRAFADAGLPKGVIGLLFGNPSDISQQLISSPFVQKVTFTGSTPVGKQLAALAGRHMKRVSMELGGHAPLIVAEDADIERAADACLLAKFRNAGQVCIAPSRFLVHASIEKAFTRALCARVQQIQVGDGLLPASTMGPLANQRRATAMHSFVDDTLRKGATWAAGEKVDDSGGYFFAPHVFTDVPLSASLFNEEPFGPIVAIRTFNRLQEAIQESNRLPYGLASYLFTESLNTLHQVSQDIQAGMLWVNQAAKSAPEMPFGGQKDSGYGSEGGMEALEAYLNTKAVSVCFQPKD